LTANQNEPLNEKRRPPQEGRRERAREGSNTKLHTKAPQSKKRGTPWWSEALTSRRGTCRECHRNLALREEKGEVVGKRPKKNLTCSNSRSKVRAATKNGFKGNALIIVRWGYRRTYTTHMSLEGVKYRRRASNALTNASKPRHNRDFMRKSTPRNVEGGLIIQCKKAQEALRKIHREKKHEETLRGKRTRKKQHDEPVNSRTLNAPRRGKVHRTATNGVEGQSGD